MVHRRRINSPSTLRMAPPSPPSCPAPPGSPFVPSRPLGACPSVRAMRISSRRAPGVSRKWRLAKPPDRIGWALIPSPLMVSPSGEVTTSSSSSWIPLKLAKSAESASSKMMVSAPGLLSACATAQRRLPSPGSSSRRLTLKVSAWIEVRARQLPAKRRGGTRIKLMGFSRLSFAMEARGCDSANGFMGRVSRVPKRSWPRPPSARPGSRRRRGA